MSVAAEDGMEGIIWFSYLLEILIYLMTFITVPMCHFIASTAQVYHTNTLLMIHVGFYHFYIYGLGRMAMIYYESQLTLTCEIYAETTETCPIGLQIASFARLYPMILNIAGFSGIMFERIMALYFYATYEHQYYRPHFIGIIAFGILFALGLSGCFIFALPFFTRNIANAVEIVSTFMTGLVTLMIAKINDDLQSKLHLKDYTLSKRYQLTVNFKAIRIIQIYIVHTMINNIIYSILFGIHQAPISWTARNILGVFMNLQLALQYFTFSWMGSFCTRQTRELSIKILSEKWKEIKRFHNHIDAEEERRNSEEKPVINTSGKVMYMGAKQDDYFAQLNAQWG